MEKKNLCKCGCGELVAQNYRHGHGRRGKKNSEYHNRRISECHLGKKWTEEQRVKFITTRTGMKRPPYISGLMRKIALERGFGKWMKGRKLPKDVIEKGRLKRIGHFTSVETRRKIGLANSGKNNGMYGVKYSDEYRKEQSVRMKKIMRCPEVMVKWHVSRSTPEFKRFLRFNAINTHKKLYGKGYVTKPEKLMAVILSELGFEFKHYFPCWKIEHSFVADFYLPDFRIIIEVDGLYWHKFPHGRDIDSARNKELEAAGFHVIRFWENELDIDYVHEELCGVI